MTFRLTILPLRAPTAAVPGHLAVCVVASSLSSLQHLAMLRGAGPGLTSWVSLAGWWAFSFVAFSTLFVGLPLWERLVPCLAGVNSARAWSAYVALFFALGCCGGMMRRALTALWLPGLTSGLAWVFVFNAGFTGVICALFAEVPAAFFRRHRAAAARRLALAAELNESRRQLVQADDRARRELAEVLHGRLQSRLVAALAKIEQARESTETDVIARLLDEAAGYVEGVRGEALRQVDELASQGPVSLEEAVGDLLARFGSMLPLDCTWHPGARELVHAPEVVRLVYRLLDEALLNIYRHARATRVSLELAIAPFGNLTATIRDDGVGFDPGLVRQGLGLVGPVPALAQLSGSFELRSQPGEGTTIVINLPLVAAS